MSTRDIDLALRTDPVVGEGPFFDAGELVWVDLPVGVLHRTDLATASDQALVLGGVLGAAVPRAGGGYVAATDVGFGFIEGDAVRVVDPVVEAAHLRMNDGKCDALGRFWAGSTSFTEDQPVGALHVWEPGQPARVVDSGFILPNGVGWSPDNATLYFIDSMQYCLYAYDFDLPSGAASNRRVLHQFLASDGIPDGLAVDVENTVWIAFFGGSCLRRLDHLGATVETVVTPVSKPTSCAFGAGTDLYITSARVGLSGEQLAREPLAGSILRIDAGVAGTPVSKSR
jgi:sugar lactone lactonase YvrE